MGIFQHDCFVIFVLNLVVAALRYGNHLTHMLVLSRYFFGCWDQIWTCAVELSPNIIKWFCDKHKVGDWLSAWLAITSDRAELNFYLAGIHDVVIQQTIIASFYSALTGFFIVVRSHCYGENGAYILLSFNLDVDGLTAFFGFYQLSLIAVVYLFSNLVYSFLELLGIIGIVQRRYRCIAFFEANIQILAFRSVNNQIYHLFWVQVDHILES